MRAAILAGALHTSGRRLTRQRQLLLELMQSHPGHLDAQELYELARERDPRMSLSTVYRTVGLLHGLGLVDELHLGEEHHHYEVRPAAAHHHLICAGCGLVVEFSNPLTESLMASVASEYGFQIEEAQIDFTGYCERCRSARDNQKTA